MLDQQAPIAGPRRARAVPPAPDLIEIRATERRSPRSVANPATAQNVDSIVPSPTPGRPSAAPGRTTVTPSPTRIDRLAATSVTSARRARNAALVRAAPGETGEAGAHRHATGAPVATTLAGPPVRVTPRTSRGHRDPVIDAQHRNARHDRAATRASTRTRVIGDRVCPRAIAHPVAAARNVPAS
jgi:hypothetical protein